jgi:riboflavin kinase / FMN adenylyltransferase
VKVLRGEPGTWETGTTRRAVAVGVFDGLHAGHRRVLTSMRELAARRSLETCVVTFDPHPLAVVAPEHAPRLLTTIEQRIELLDGLGVDVVAVVPFDDEVRRLSPAAFVTELLVDRVHAAVVVVGEDFRFGRDRTGHTGLLREMGAALGFDVEVVPLVGSDRPVSSTRIRDLIAAGDVAAAADALSRPHEVIGTVVEGAGRGGDLGVPTANVVPDPGVVLPARGVYAVLAGRSAHESLPGVANLGVRPTFDGGDAEVLEVHLLDRDMDLLGERLRVRFVERIRDERTFPDVGALTAQIRADIDRARLLIG